MPPTVANPSTQVNPTMSEPSTGEVLARRELGSVITTPSEFRSYLQAQKELRYHILSPATDFGALPAQWSLIPSIVQIDPDPVAGDVYADRLFCSGDEVAIAKPGLRKLARAGGLSWTTTREDDGRVQYYWEVKATVTYRGFDGQMKTAEAMADYDLRDGSPRVSKMVNAAKRNNRNADAQIEGARMYGLRGCEARAINAAIREFGIRQKYTKAELAKPFVVFNLVFQPDMSDPQQKAAVLQGALMNTALLYGGTALPPSDPTTHAKGTIIDVEPEPAGEPSKVTEEPAQPVNAVPFDEEPEQPKETKKAEPTFHISGVFASGGNFFLKTVEAPNLPIWTDDKSTAQAAVAAKKANTELVIEMEKRGNDTWLVGFSTVEKL